MTDLGQTQMPGEQGPLRQKRAPLTEAEIEALPEATELLERTREFLQRRRLVRIVERRLGCCRQRILTIEVDADSPLQDGDLWYSDMHSCGPDQERVRRERREDWERPVEAREGRVHHSQVQTRGLSDGDIGLLWRAQQDANKRQEREIGVIDPSLPGWTTFKVKGQNQPPAPPLPPLP